jgi:hypothetical protein
MNSKRLKNNIILSIHYFYYLQEFSHMKITQVCNLNPWIIYTHEDCNPNKVQIVLKGVNSLFSIHFWCVFNGYPCFCRHFAKKPRIVFNCRIVFPYILRLTPLSRLSMRRPWPSSSPSFFDLGTK